VFSVKLPRHALDGLADLSVYVDHAFAFGDWGRWSGGGHMQADALGELHEFAERIGLRHEWFQSKPARPENDHYDLTRAKRELAIELGAISEDRRAGTRRRQAVRLARRASNRLPAPAGTLLDDETGAHSREWNGR